jgi:hypothetical protein
LSHKFANFLFIFFQFVRICQNEVIPGDKNNNNNDNKRMAVVGFFLPTDLASFHVVCV